MCHFKQKWVIFANIYPDPAVSVRHQKVMNIMAPDINVQSNCRHTFYEMEMKGTTGKYY